MMAKTDRWKMGDVDGPWESGRRYLGPMIDGLAPLEELVSPDAMWAASGETLMSALFLREGLLALERELKDSTGFYPAAFQLLGQGVEHLLKLALVLAKLRTEGSLPTAKSMKRVGHGLSHLRDELLVCLLHPKLLGFPDGEGFRRAAVVLASSGVNDYLLGLLEGHSRGSRYFYLETLLGNRDARDPHDEFEHWLDHINEASRDLYENAEDDEIAPLAEHILADRPGAYRRDRDLTIYFHLLGFLSVTSITLVLLRGDGWEGPLRPLTRIRTLRRPPKPWRSDW